MRKKNRTQKRTYERINRVNLFLMAKNLELSLKNTDFFKEGEISEMKVIKDIINNKLKIW